MVVSCAQKRTFPSRKVLRECRLFQKENECLIGKGVWDLHGVLLYFREYLMHSLCFVLPNYMILCRYMMKTVQSHKFVSLMVEFRVTTEVSKGKCFLLDF